MNYMAVIAMTMLAMTACTKKSETNEVNNFKIQRGTNVSHWLSQSEERGEVREQHIQEDDFELPALSIQPIVENAIRHGVRGRYNGSVKVMTRSDENEIIITVTDNGKGFNPDEAETAEGTHIGLRNVRERIGMLCGGTLSVESSEGMGCTVSIRLPRRKERG